MLFGEFTKSQAEAEYPELWRGLVGAWSPCLNPRGGTTLYDLSGRGNYGTLTNMDPATDWVTSGGKTALDFDGSNDRVEISDSASISFSGQFGIVCWYWSSSGLSSSDVLISKRLSPTYNYLLYFSATNKPVIYSDGLTPASLTSSTAAPSSQLHCVVATYHPSLGRSLYIDGVLRGSDAPTGTPTTNTGKLHIGSDLTGSFAYPGLIFDAVLSETAYNASAANAFYHLGPGGWATPRRRRWNYATAQTAIPYWVFARKNARLIGGGVS